MTFLRNNFSSINLYDQLRERESNFKIQNQPHVFVSQLFRERLRVAKNLYKTDLVGHFGCVNAVEFSQGGKFLASGGDDKRVLVWDIEKSLAGIGYPRVLDSEHASNIFCLGFDSQNHKLISGGNDDLVISHDFETGKLDNVFKQDNPVYGLSIDPQNDNIFATASENGKILLFDQRKDPIAAAIIADKRSSFHAVEFHPLGGNLLITANSRYGAALYDIRKPNQPTIEYMQVKDPRSCMSVRFNRSGNLILALRRRLSPILYKLGSPEPVCTFHHKNYYNSCTMKSCTFAGQDDELILSGSDDFNLYVWRLSDVDLERTDQMVQHSQMVLYGHRSIVNQVRYNYQKCLLASSGVEKIVKIWSPFSQRDWSGSLLEEATCSDNPREIFYPFFGSVMTVASMSHDYSTRNTNEDPRMLAFFDTLIRQEIEGSELNSSTNTSLESDDSSSNFNISLDSSSTSESNSSYTSTSGSDDDNDDDNNDNNQPLSTTTGSSRNSKQILKRKLITKRRMPLTLKRRHVPFQNMKRIFRIRPLQHHKKRIGYLRPKKRRTVQLLNLNSSGYQRSRPPRSKRVDFWHIDSEKPTTSAAAAAATLQTTPTSSHKQTNHNKKKSKLSSHFDLSNLSVSSEENTSYARTGGTPNINNVVVPSTSTGITTSLRDDILRLRRQQQLIIDSDEDDDDDDDNQNDSKNLATNESQRNDLSATKKLNGLQNDIDVSAVTTTSTTHHTSSSHRSLRTYQGPKNSAALSIESSQNHQTLYTNSTTTTITTLPQSVLVNNQNSHSPSNNSHSATDCNQQNEVATIRTVNSNHKLPKRRLRTSWDFSELYASHSNSDENNGNGSGTESNDTPPRWRNYQHYNSKQQKEGEDDEENSNISICSTILPSPAKRRKISLADYIQKRQNSVEGDRGETSLEENNNEQNNNEVNVGEINMNMNGNVSSQETPPRRIGSNNHQQHTGNGSLPLTANVYFTPDSGISLTNSSTPSSTGRVMTYGSYHHYNDAAASTSRAAIPLTPCLETDESSGDNGLGPIVNNNNSINKNKNKNNNNKSKQNNVNVFKKKVARIRRNYLKQFAADDSESD